MSEKRAGLVCDQHEKVEGERSAQPLSRAEASVYSPRALNTSTAEAVPVQPLPRDERGLQLSPWFVLLVLLALLALHLYTIGIHALGEPDEPRYAEIGREMLVLDDWVTPHLNFVKYFEKPPLVYWMTAASLRTFGIDEFGARLPVVVSGFMTLLIVWVLATRMYGGSTPLLATIILATSFFPAMLQQVLTLDTPLTCLITIALAAVWFGHESSGRTWYRIAYVATALGVLTKGPVAVVLVGAIAGIFLLAAGGWSALRRAVDGVGIALAVAIITPWFALVSWRNPEFLPFFVVDQHLKRYLWTDEHGQPFWFFLALLPVVLTPWSLIAFTDPFMWTRRWRPREWSKATRFLLLWAIVIVGFFTLSKSKLLTYILPAVPALAILLGRLFNLALEEGDDAFLRRGAVLLLIIGVGTFISGAVLGFFIDQWRFPLIRPYLFAGGAFMAAIGFVARRSLRFGATATLMVLTAGFVGFMALGIHGRNLGNSFRELSRVAAGSMRPGDRLVDYVYYYQSPAFYSGRRVIMVGGTGELEFGSHQGDNAAFFWKNDDDLRREWSRPGGIYLFIRKDDLARIAPLLEPPPIQLAEEYQVILVTNHAPAADETSPPNNQ